MPLLSARPLNPPALVAPAQGGLRLDGRRLRLELPVEISKELQDGLLRGERMTLAIQVKAGDFADSRWVSWEYDLWDQVYRVDIGDGHIRLESSWEKALAPAQIPWELKRLPDSAVAVLVVNPLDERQVEELKRLAQRATVQERASLIRSSPLFNRIFDSVARGELAAKGSRTRLIWNAP